MSLSSHCVHVCIPWKYFMYYGGLDWGMGFVHELVHAKTAYVDWQVYHINRLEQLGYETITISTFNYSTSRENIRQTRVLLWFDTN